MVHAESNAAEPSVIVEPMLEADLDAVAAIEKKSFTTPWSRQSFAAELEGNRFARFWVARSLPAPGSVVAYICCWVIYEELRINNIAVHPDRRRCGIAQSLLAQAVHAAREAGCLTGYLEVRPGNEAALGLYGKFGFSQAGRRPLYYADTCEDALILSVSLESSSG